MKPVFLVIAAVTTMASALPGAAVAQHHGTRAQRADNAADRADLRARIDETDRRIEAAQASRAITRTRASELRRQLATTRQGYARATRGQGFVSAAESATFNRTLDSIDARLTRR